MVNLVKKLIFDLGVQYIQKAHLPSVELRDKVSLGLPHVIHHCSKLRLLSKLLL